MKTSLLHAAASVFLLVCLCWIATLGSWEILRGEFLGVAYDSLASHLLRGSAEVDQGAIQFERYELDGKVFMYFGPFPALVRILLNFMAPGHYGAWSRVSTVAAVFLSAITFGRMVNSALTINQSITSQSKKWLTIAAPLILGLGTPLAFLLSAGNIYHEAMAWGICGTLLSLRSTLDLAINPKRRVQSMRVFSIGFAVSLLSRLTTAIPALLLMPFVLVRYIRLELPKNHSRLSIPRKLIVPCGTILISSLFQLWYNYDRFGSVLVFRDLSKYFFSKTHLGPDFYASRLPDAVIHYFGVSSRHFLDRAPFIGMVTSIYQRPELFVLPWREQTISLSLSAPWLLIAGSVGTLYALIRPCQSLSRIALLATLVQALLVMSYFFISQRYAAELVPFFVVGLCVFASQCRLNRLWFSALVAASALSVFVTLTSAIRFHMLFDPPTPAALRQPFESLFFPDIAAALVDSRATSITDLIPLADPSATIPAYPNRDVFDRPLRLLTYSALKGLGMRASSRVSYEVPPDTIEFRGIAMLSERSAACNEITLTFEGHNEDGTLIFQQRISSNTPDPIPLSASIVAVRRLTISLRQDIQSPLCDAANLYAARFIRKR